MPILRKKRGASRKLILSSNQAANIFYRPESGRLKLSSLCLNIMLSYLQEDVNIPEAGGVLLGRYILDTQDIVIDEVTRPMIRDRRTRHGFFRSRENHQQVIDRAWKKSDGTCTYLGEWHTHPEAVPTPSITDKINWQKKLLFDKFSRYLFFVVVGTTHLKIWEGEKRRYGFRPLWSVRGNGIHFDHNQS